ncbi:sialate O-acetylesterase [Planctomycetota bacterium]
MNPYRSRVLSFALACAVLAAWPAAGAEEPKVLPDPDGKPADMRRPVQVYILLGQSNMLSFGDFKKLNAAVKEKKKYPYLVDDDGEWTVRKDVRFVWVGGSGGPGRTRLMNNDWMKVKGNIGVEMGIGHHMGHLIDAPVMILKSATGNRSLGWDLLPPGSKQYEFEEKGKTWVYAGYGDSPERWEKGTNPKRIAWTAGCQYAGDVDRAKKVLSDLGTYYPGATKYEVAGFFYWQGDKDRYNAGHATRYEFNLVNLIKQLRKDFNAPNAKFVCATLGQTSKGAGGNEGHILNAQLAVDGTTGKYPEFRGNVASVYSKPFCHGGSSSGHYGGNAETYMDVGEAMGRAMVKLMGEKGGRRGLGDPKGAAALADAEKLVEEKQYLEAVTALRRLTVSRRGSDTGRLAAERLKALLDDPAISRLVIDTEADAFEARCVAAEKKKDYALAIKLYERYVKQFPEASRFAAVRAHVELLKSDKAIQAGIKSAQAEAECSRWMVMADNYARNGLNDKARQYLRKIVAKYGDTRWGARARSRLAALSGQ